jgi:hypothetical protein
VVNVYHVLGDAPATSRELIVAGGIRGIPRVARLDRAGQLEFTGSLPSFRQARCCPNSKIVDLDAQPQICSSAGSACCSRDIAGAECHRWPNCLQIELVVLHLVMSTTLSLLAKPGQAHRISYHPPTTGQYSGLGFDRRKNFGTKQLPQRC